MRYCNIPEHINSVSLHIKLMSHTYTYTHTQTDFLVSPKYSFSSKGSFLLMSIFRKSEKKKLNE